LRPIRLDRAPRGPHKASLVAEHNYGISTDDEFIRLKNLKLKRFKYRFAIVFELFPPVDRSAPR
jgi:hypothetical protein